MSNDDYSNLRDKIEDVSRMLVGLRRSQLGG